MQHNNDDKYICVECGSKTRGAPGKCCGAAREKVCGACGHPHKGSETCDCGCDES